MCRNIFFSFKKFYFPLENVNIKIWFLKAPFRKHLLSSIVSELGLLRNPYQIIIITKASHVYTSPKYHVHKRNRRAVSYSSLTGNLSSYFT